MKPLPRNSWFNEECKEAIERKNVRKIRTLNHDTRSWREAYKLERKAAKKLFQHKKREHNVKKLRAIESESLMQNPENSIRKLKMQQPSTSPNADSLGRAMGN